jgi:hypothetical protein
MFSFLPISFHIRRGLGVVGYRLWKDHRLSRDGIVLIGRILPPNKDEEAVYFQHEYKSSSHWVMNYTFKTPKGRYIKRRHNLGTRLFVRGNLPEEGDCVAIVYVTDWLFDLL